MIPTPFTREREGADALAEGYYLLRVGGGRVPVPVRIWFGPPIEPGTEDVLDRSWRWQIKIGHQLFDEDERSLEGIKIRHLDDIWPKCANEPIDRAEYEYLIARSNWAYENEDSDPYRNFGAKIDLLNCPIP